MTSDLQDDKVNMKNIKDIKKDFPIFTTYTDLVYLDSASTSQKPKIVIDAVFDFYTKYNSNVHRGLYDLSQKATDLYEESRKKVSSFINAKDPSEIIFTGNATEAINLVATGFAKKFLKRGDIIVTTEMEHHSNIVPWLQLKKERGIKIVYLPISLYSCLVYDTTLISGLDFKKVKLVSLTHASNVLGTINPVEKIIKVYKSKCPNAKFLVDGAQSIPHLKIDVQKMECDFFVFSSHKMYGPSGVGVLYAKRELLDEMDPLFYGSQMIDKVTKEKATFAGSPDKFEAGTGKLEAVVGLGAAIDFLSGIGMEQISLHEQKFTEYALNSLKKIKGVTIYGPDKITNRLPVFSFNIGNVHPHDVAEILNRKNICVRAGHHCAQPLMEVLKVPGTVRASFSIYNTISDVDALVDGIKDVKKVFKQ